MTRRHRWLLALGAVTVVVAMGSVGAAVAATSGETTGLTAAFTKTSDWGTGYEAKYTISNPGTSSVSAWRVEFGLPSSATLGAFWEAAITRSGDRFVATNKAYNGTLAAGGSTTFG